MTKLKKILKWGMIGSAAIIAILLVIHTVLAWVAGSRLEQRLAAIREAEDPLTVADLAPEPVPSDENAATYLRRARANLRSFESELEDVYVQERFRKGDLSEDDTATIRSLLEAYPDVIPLIQRAAASGRLAADLDYTLDSTAFMEQIMSDVQDFRAAPRVVWANSLVLVADGQYDLAMERCIELFRLTRLYDEQPTTICYLVSLACRGIAVVMASNVLNRGTISAEMREKLRQELEQHDAMDGFVWSVKSERAFGNTVCREWYDQWSWTPISPYYQKQNHAGYLDRLDHELSLGSASYHQEIGQRLTASEIKQLGWQAVSISSALTASRDAMNRTRAMIRCLSVQNGLHAHIESQGSSDALVLEDAGLPTEVTTDPFTGKPLLVKRTKAGWAIYSVGQNLTDDGGSLEQREDIGLVMDVD